MPSITLLSKENVRLLTAHLESPRADPLEPPVIGRKALVCAGALRITATAGREIAYLHIGAFSHPLMPRTRIWRVKNELIFGQPTPGRFWVLEIPPGRIDVILARICSLLPPPVNSDISDPLAEEMDSSDSKMSPLVIDAIETCQKRVTERSEPVVRSPRSVSAGSHESRRGHKRGASVVERWTGRSDSAGSASLASSPRVTPRASPRSSPVSAKGLGNGTLNGAPRRGLNGALHDEDDDDSVLNVSAMVGSESPEPVTSPRRAVSSPTRIAINFQSTSKLPPAADPESLWESEPESDPERDDLGISLGREFQPEPVAPVAPIVVESPATSSSARTTPGLVLDAPIGTGPVDATKNDLLRTLEACLVGMRPAQSPSEESFGPLSPTDLAKNPVFLATPTQNIVASFSDDSFDLEDPLFSPDSITGSDTTLNDLRDYLQWLKHPLLPAAVYPLDSDRPALKSRDLIRIGMRVPSDPAITTVGAFISWQMIAASGRVANGARSAS